MKIALSDIKVTVGRERRPLFAIDDLKIRTGDKVLIKGASGRGKTTFLHLLAGLLLPDQGRIVLGETEISKLDDASRTRFRRAHIGLIFQKLNLIEHLTALENVELSMSRPANLAKAKDALRLVGLSGREDERTSVLSLGEQQRVAVARVLAGQSEIVFADEPTSSLDEKNAVEVTKLLIDASQAKTLIVVSHDQRIETYFSTIKNFEDLIL